jgi:hypothetical protein
LGYLRVDGSDSIWLSVVITVVALVVITTLSKQRSTGDGVLIMVAILSPSILMGIERGNIDLLVLALVGAAALIFEEQRLNRILCTTFLVGIAIVLKLYPIFCVALAARFSRRTFIFAAALVVLCLLYFAAISDYIAIIRRNTPITGILSYGYLASFLGLDHLRSEAELAPFGLANTWLPIIVAALTLTLAAITAIFFYACKKSFCIVRDNAVGTAFLFGAGIYCGTFMLGTNFIYRLMFLLLCLPQLQDWANARSAEVAETTTVARVLLALIILALWLSGSSNGHTTFSFMPQFLHWAIFFGFTSIFLGNILESVGRSEEHITMAGAQADW